MQFQSIKVLGSGCKYCHELLENTSKTAKKMGIDTTVEFVTDMEKVVGYGVMSTPALVVNEKVVSMGKVLKPAGVEKLFNKLMEENKDKKKVAFICVHNSCRSQIAEALGKKYASDIFESYSAGTEVKDHINPDALRLIKQMYDIDMEQTQHSKLLADIPTPDVAIYMGCNVSCPNLTAQYSENWGLDDPTGKSDEEFIKVIKSIEENIFRLMEKLK